jgi:HSP20 family protein
MFNRMLFDDFRRSFDRLLEGFGSSRAICSEVPFAWTFAPAVETGWTEDHFNLRLIVPGVTENDLKVTVQGNQLYVQGERKEPKELSKSDDSFRELTYGKFESMINLPGGLELEKLEAHLHDGVLDIRIPVAAAMKPREIPISAGSPKALAA